MLWRLKEPARKLVNVNLAKLQAVQESANAGIFGRIADYAFGEHDRLHKRQKFTARQRIVPTALAISGCINPADHAETFPILLQKLKDKVSHISLSL